MVILFFYSQVVITTEMKTYNTLMYFCIPGLCIKASECLSQSDRVIKFPNGHRIALILSCSSMSLPFCGTVGAHSLHH